MIDRVGYTGVLGYALISEIDLAVLIQGNVLKQSVSLDCIVDIWLRILIQVDNLSVASAFKVEYAIVIPAVLIINTWYGGEMKKGMFSMMNYYLPLKGIAAMHCSAKTD